MILRNAWYAGAWSDEIAPGTVLSRTLLGEPVVLWRGNGPASALEDRCSHRGVPLSLGRVVDDVLECGYHGVCFDAQGACVRIPGQAAIPRGGAARAYPVIERHGLIWLWFGPPETADAAAIPDVHWAADAGWAAPHGYFRLAAAHEMLIENLSNHTHLQFVHRNTIGTDGISEVNSKVRRFDDQVEITRWLLGRQPPALFARAGGFSGLVDRWFHSVFTPPSTIVLDIGCAVAGSGAPEGDRSAGIEIRSIHVISPETTDSTHYFWSYARNFKVDDEATSALLRDGAYATFLEDVAILEAQQRNSARFPNAARMNIAADAGATMTLRLRGEIAARTPYTPG